MIKTPLKQCSCSFGFTSIICQAAISVKISNLLICFCSFDLSCPILEKDNFITNLYITLSILNSVFLILFVSIKFNASSLTSVRYLLLLNSVLF